MGAARCSCGVGRGRAIALKQGLVERQGPSRVDPFLQAAHGGQDVSVAQILQPDGIAQAYVRFLFWHAPNIVGRG